MILSHPKYEKLLAEVFGRTNQERVEALGIPFLKEGGGCQSGDSSLSAFTKIMIFNSLMIFISELTTWKPTGISLIAS